MFSLVFWVQAAKYNRYEKLMNVVSFCMVCAAPDFVCACYMLHLILFIIKIMVWFNLVYCPE